MSIIVVDPGHGGATAVGDSSPNNATSPSGLLEKHLTLEVARHAAAALSARGHAVHLTRTADMNLGLADRAHVARDAAADAFVSIHFNGFGDPTVQGTETWVHLSSSAASQDLADCVQRSALRVTRHRDRGIQAKRLGVLSPPRHHERTAACLAELSFITTNDEDRRLQDPRYLRDLGGAVANGIDEYVRRPASRAFVAAALAAAPSFTNLKVADVPNALAALPGTGKGTKFSGEVKDKGGGFTHVQGVVPYKDVYLLTHSDEFENSGRLLVADRATQAFARQFTLPVVSTSPRYFHAGGCQLIGDILVIPSEARKNKSVVAFFDVSDPANIREFDESLRVFNDQRDAAAAGITNVTRDGKEVWVLAVFDSGTVTVYQSPDLAGREPFTLLFSVKVNEKDHQALPLVTDTADRVFALGINRGNLLSDDVVILYHVDLVNGTIKPFPDEDKAEFKFSTPGDASLRWGSCVDIVSESKLVMHCTSKHYRNGCHFNVFDAAQPAATLVAKRAAAGRRRPRKAAKRRTKTAKRRRPKTIEA